MTFGIRYIASTRYQLYVSNGSQAVSVVGDFDSRNNKIVNNISDHYSSMLIFFNYFFIHTLRSENLY